MKQYNKKNRVIIILVVLGFIVLFLGFYFYQHRTKIEFKQKETMIEYGETFSYKDCILKTTPEQLKIEYPQLEIKEVGKYETVFKYGKNLNKETTHMIIVKDSVKPKIELEIDKRVETHVNKEYNPFSNLKSVENIEQYALDNKKMVSEKEYKKIVTKVKKENERIHNRVIRKNKDIDNKKMKGNFIIASTNLDLNKKGIYEMKVAAVDENLNVTEKQWKIKVVDQRKLLNRGGKVVCNYPSETIEETESIISDYKEIYVYDKNKNVIGATFEVSMKLTEDYDTEENTQNIINDLNNEYVYMKNIKGAEFKCFKQNEIIYAVITIDFTQYDTKKDEAEVLINEEGKFISIEDTFKNAEESANCSIE